MATTKLKLLADAWRQVRYDDQGRRVGFRRFRRGDEIEVDSSQVERLLNLKRFDRPYFEEVKATEEKKEESKPATQTVTRTASSDRK